jgi:DNA-binding NarL/FixJ family response regulator
MRGKTAGSVLDMDAQRGGLSPRLRQTLEHLLRGDGEKQIAAKLGLSQHTIHVYVKSLHKHYSVCSRSELLARFIAK